MGKFPEICFIILGIEKMIIFSIPKFQIKILVRNKMNMRFLITIALFCAVFFLVNCGGGSTNTANTATKPGDTTKTDTASTDSVGVPECDEYIKKYEACLTKIAKDAPQAQPGLKTAFEQQRTSFKQAAANPQSKATLPSTCKQMMETAKQSTASYKCEW